MPHVTFIHGLANKPPADILYPVWLRALADGGGLHLGNEGVTSSMVYWADVLYESPDTDPANYETSLENRAEQVDGGGAASLPVAATPEEAKFIEGLRRELTRVSAEAVEAEQAPGPDDPNAVGLERIPLPWFIKKRIMAAWLRDAHHYYFNKTHAPRPGTSYQVQVEIRRRFVDALSAAPAGNGPHIVVSHSMGTMIAYDCLKRVPGCPAIDGLITIGSPLGLDEVQDCNKPEWTRDDGFPGGKVRGRWVNVFDHLDVVCGADPHLANDFRRAGAPVIEDVKVTNDGAWRHSIAKYLRQGAVRDVLRTMLQL